MDQVRVKKTVESSAVAKSAPLQPVKPIRQNVLLNPKPVGINPKVFAKLKVAGRVSAVNQVEQKRDEQKVAGENEQFVAGNQNVRSLDNKASIEKVYGKGSASIFNRLAQRRIIPGVPKSVLKQGANSKQVNKLVRKTAYTKKDLALMKKLRPLAVIPKKLTEKIFVSYHQYLKLKGELSIASDNRRKAELRTAIEELETSTPFLKTALDAASFDDLKDSLLNQYQLVVTQMIQTKTFDASKMEAFASKFGILSAQVSGLVDKVHKQQSTVEQMDGMGAKIDAKIAEVSAVLANEKSEPKRRHIERELQELTKHKDMVRQMVNDQKAQLLNLNTHLDKVKLSRDKINALMAKFVTTKKVDILSMANVIGEMSDAMTNISSVLVGEQTLTLWANESALQFISVWATYQFMSDIKNMDDPVIRDYVVEMRSKGLSDIENTINQFIASFAAATIDFTNLNKKYEQAANLAARSKMLVNSLNNEILQLRESIQNMEHQVGVDEKQIAENEKQRRQIKLQIAKIKARLLVVEVDIGIADRKQSDIQEKEMTIDALKKDVATLESVAGRANSILNQTSEPVMQALRASLMWKRIADEFEGTRNALGDEVQEQMQQEIKINKQREAEMKQQVSDLQKEKDDLLRQQAQLQGEKKIDKEQLKIVQEQLDEIENKRISAQQRVEQLTAELLLQGDAYSKAVAEQQLLKNQISQKDEELRQMVQKQEEVQQVLQDVEQRKSQLEQSIQRQKSEFEQKASQDLQKVSELQSKIDELDQQIASNDEVSAKRIEAEKAKLQKELDGKLIAIQAEKQQLQTRIDQFENEKRQAIENAREQEQQNAAAAMNKLETDNTALKTQLTEVGNKLQTADKQSKRELENQRVQLQAQIDAKIDEIANLNKETEKRINEAVEKTEKRITNEKNAIIAQLNEQISEASDREQQLKSEHTAELERVRREEASRYQREKEEQMNNLKIEHDAEIASQKEASRKDAEKVEEDHQKEIDRINNSAIADKTAALEKANQTYQANVAKLQKEAEEKLTAEQEKYQQQVTELEHKHAREIANYKQQLETQKQEAIANLENLKNEMEQEKTEIQQELDAAQSRIQRMEADKNAIQEQLNNLKAGYEIEKGEWNIARQQLEADIESKQRTIDSQNQEIAAQKSTINQLTADNEAKNEQVNILNARVTSIEGELSTAKQNLQTKTALASDLQGKLTAEQKTNQTLKGQVDAKEQQLVDEKKKLEAAGLQIEEINEQLTAEQKKLADMKTQYEQSVERENDLKQKLEKTSADLNTAKNRIQQLTGENEELEKKVQTLNAEMSKQNLKIEALEKEVDGLRSQLSDANKKALGLQQQLNAANKQLGELANEKAKVDKENVELKKQVKQKDEVIEAQKTELAKKDEEIGNLKKTIETLNGRIEYLEKENNSLKSELNIEKLGREALQNILNQGGIRAQKWDWQNIQDAVKKLIVDKSSLQKEKQTLESEKSALESEKSALEQQKSKYASVLNKVLPFFGSKTLDQVTVTDIDKKVDALWKELAPVLEAGDKKENLFAVLQRVATQVQTQKAQIDKLNKEIEAQNKEIEAQNKEITEQNTKITTLEADKKKLEDDNKKLEDDKKKLDADLAAARADLKKVASLDALIKQKVQSEIDDTKKSAKGLQTTLEAIIKNHAGVSSTVKTQLNTTLAKLTQLLTDIGGVSLDSKTSEEILETHLQKVTKLTRETEEIKGKVDQWKQGIFYTQALLDEELERTNLDFEHLTTELRRKGMFVEYSNSDATVKRFRADVVMNIQSVKLVFEKIGASIFGTQGDRIVFDLKEEQSESRRKEIAIYETEYIAHDKQNKDLIFTLAKQLLDYLNTITPLNYGPAHIDLLARFMMTKVAQQIKDNGVVKDVHYLWDEMHREMNAFVSNKDPSADALLAELRLKLKSSEKQFGEELNIGGDVTMETFSTSGRFRAGRVKDLQKLMKAKEDKDEAAAYIIVEGIVKKYSKVWGDAPTMSGMQGLLTDFLINLYKSPNSETADLGLVNKLEAAAVNFYNTDKVKDTAPIAQSEDRSQRNASAKAAQQIAAAAPVKKAVPKSSAKGKSTKAKKFPSQGRPKRGASIKVSKNIKQKPKTPTTKTKAKK